MIAEKAKEAIELAINFEHNNITTKYGDVYASEHEGYAVLKEEVEEAVEELSALHQDVEISLWMGIRKNREKKSLEHDINTIKTVSIRLACEAVQCAAVCERFLETIK